nr:hypothetical protein [Kibdelosporangium sp. MJ126-NF4]
MTTSAVADAYIRRFVRLEPVTQELATVDVDPQWLKLQSSGYIDPLPARPLSSTGLTCTVTERT